MLLEVNVKLRRGHFNLATQLSVDHTSVGLFGHSGAGKSTLLSLIAGNLQAESGHIVLDGQVLFDSRNGIIVPPEQRSVGTVLEIEYADLQGIVRDYLLAAYQLSLNSRRLFEVDYLVDLLELGSLLDQSIQRLTRNERMRVELASSLLKSPKLLLLDETFDRIGNGYRMQLIPILKRLQNEFSLPVVYASQSLGEILDLTDQLIVLENGQVTSSGSLREVAKRQSILRYIGIRQIDNILPVSILSHDYEFGCSLADSFGLPLTLPLRPHFKVGSQTQISIRANDIALSLNYIEGISIQNQIKGRICALIPSTESMLVQVDCGGTLLVEITLGACRNLALREGNIVYCLIKTHAIVYLADLDVLPYQRVLSHGDQYYYLGAIGS